MNAYVDTRETSALTELFAQKVDRLLLACEARGVMMKPYFTVRGPATQAKLWCQSRTGAEIARAAEEMRRGGAVWLPSLLKPEFGSRGARVTNALPGASWHQWGEAVDCYVVGPKGEAVWSGEDAGYRVYAEEASRLGLEAGFSWKRLKDAVHVQERAAGSPLSAGMSWAEVEAEMVLRFRR
jgi:peptidoglycan LD-endopeptidase CwlK